MSVVYIFCNTYIYVNECNTVVLLKDWNKGVKVFGGGKKRGSYYAVALYCFALN
jgi:hypothetical protein